MTDEKLLIDRAQKGDKDAFRRLVERSKITTYRLAYDLTGNRHDAEDLSQEAYIRAFRGLAGFRGDAKWSSWLHRITLNTFLDHKRVNKKQNIEYNDELETTETMNPTRHTPPAPNPEKSAEAGVIRQHVERALGCLSAQERSVFVLRHYQDLPLKEIAAAMDLAEGTVKVHLFRAIRRLQKELHFYRTDFGLEGRRP
ncbi:MAG TPA: RNA polymerase sigma factor [Bacteroidota bacterium]|nr:RNA polymerase sigma factor [Bacteroidota bacterium]